MLLGYLAITGITMMHEKEFGKDQTPESAYHPPTSNHAVGAITTVIQDTGWFSCGSSPAALDEMIKWATLKDQQEVIRTLIKTGSTRVTPGTRVKVLDYQGFSKLKVRILGGVATGVECWVDPEWLN